MTRSGLVLAALVLIPLAACTAGPGSSASPGSEGPVTSEGPSDASPSASLELASPQPSKSAPGGGRLYTGTLGSDAIEGGCTYLQTADGQRLEVIYPDGWNVQRAPLALVDPGGQVVARAGDEVTIRGDEAQDMVSICQIGPIVRATEVLTG
jgi:hypothetical protein